MLTSIQKFTLFVTAILFIAILALTNSAHNYIKAEEPITPPRFCPRVYCPDGGTATLINGKCGCPSINPVE